MRLVCFYVIFMSRFTSYGGELNGDDGYDSDVWRFALVQGC